MWNYVVSAQKPTSVTLSATGAFTGPNDLNLLVSKNSRLEIFLLTEKGLQLIVDVPIYGRISALELFRPPKSNQDWLFILIEKYKFCILSFDVDEKKIVTEANGDIADKIARPREMGQIAVIDPDRRMIGMHLYDGLFKVIPMDPVSGGISDAFNVRLNETGLIDLKFLSNCSVPTIGILYSDPFRTKYFKTYEILVSEKKMNEVLIQEHIDSSASMILPLPSPLGGVLIFGDQKITYYDCKKDRSPPIATPIKKTLITAYGKIDNNGSRYLLGDCKGKLHLLVLEQSANKLTNMKIEFLGQTSRPTTLSYLDNGFVFIGSCLGDSQLIKLLNEKVKVPNVSNQVNGDQSTRNEGSFLQIVESYPNLGPILDFCVVDLDRQGQGQIVTCSGAFQDSTIRVIRNGIGLNEQASIDLPNIKGLWSLKGESRDENGVHYDEFLCVTFIGDTRFLSIVGEEVEELELPAFYSETETLYCANVIASNILQVTSDGARLISGKSKELLYEWKTPSNKGKINSVSCNTRQLITTSGKQLTYFEITESSLIEKKTIELPNEASCVAVSGNQSEDGEQKQSQLCAVGLWNFHLVMYSLPDLEFLVSEPLGGQILPRSLLFSSFDGTPYLFCGLGDGHLTHYTLNVNQENKLGLYDRKRVTLGTQPILLSTFKTNQNTHIFAASDRPTVIYHHNKKILYSNVNLKEVNCVTGFHSSSFPSSLAIANESTLTIGAVDNIQKLHIKTISLNSSNSSSSYQCEYVRRIAHQKSTGTLLVISVLASEISEKSLLRLLDDQTFEIISTYELPESECGFSIINSTLNNSSQEYFIVGTGIILSDEAEPTQGRLLMFSVDQQTKQLYLEAHINIGGVANCIHPFNGRILAGVNSLVQIFRLTVDEETKTKELERMVTKEGHINVLSISSRGDFIIVGDMIKSIALYKYTNGLIEEVARDLDPSWLTQIAILDDDTYLGAEASFNLFTLRRNTDAQTEEERTKLSIVGKFHIGQMVNKIESGSLVMRFGESSEIKTLLFGTVNGSIGVIAQLNEEQFNFLSKLQQNLSRVIKGLGGFKFSDWRAFTTERKTENSSNFIDGDLVEQFLDLPPDKMKEVVKDINLSVEEVCRRIETLAHATH